MSKILLIALIPLFSFIPLEVTNTTAQTLPFSQNWTDASLITSDNNWGSVPGIEGFNGEDFGGGTGTDPQTLLVPTAAFFTPKVIANQSAPNTLTTGGIAEFDGIANPSIALQPNSINNSNTPHIIITLNTVNKQNINVAYNLRDLDSSADNAIQPVSLQYRVGNSGNFTNISAGFVADATTGPSLATLVTAVSAVLPAAANNQSLVQVRIITSDAVGNDEWVGIDDINVTGSFINSPPVVTTTVGTTTYIYNTPVVVDANVTVSDANNTTLASASISITNGLQPATDLLLFTADAATMGNINGSYSGGILTLNSSPATATLAQWQVALRSIRFSSSSSPANHNVTINFTVNDGSFSSNTATRALAIYASSPPVVTTSAGNTNYVHSTPVIIDNAITVSDANNTTLSSATINFSSGFQMLSGDVLSFTNNGTTMGNISGSYASFTGVLTLNSVGATATLAQWQSALRSITFYISGTVGFQDRIINFTANDGSNTSLPGTKTITISPGTAPLVTTTAGNTTYIHNTPVKIDNGISVTDTDSPTLPSASVSIKSGFEIGNDYLVFTNDGSTMGNIAGGYSSPLGILNLSSAGSTATLAQWQAALQSLTYYNAAIVPQTQNRVISITVNDGAANSNAASKTITYMPLANIEFTWSPAVQAVSPVTGGTGGDGGKYSQLLVVNGNPGIAFYDETRGNLVYVRSTDNIGTNYGPPVTLDSLGDIGQYISIQIINGNPAVSYYDATNFDLKFVRANDASGTTWGTPVTVDVTGIVGKFSSLQLVNGNPAVSYYDETNKDLKYVRAGNATGTIWSTPQSIDITGDVGQHTSLQIVNGNPAIAYYDVYYGLKYIRATDASGTSWGTPLLIDPVTNVGQFNSLKIVNGNPAISYYDALNKDLKYVYANDASGSAGGWATPFTIDMSSFNVGQYTSLEIVNGNPAISYFDVFNNSLKYIRATNVAGNSWGPPVTFYSGFGGQYSSLQMVNGSPAISFYRLGLKYLRATNTLGSSWGTVQGIDITGNVGQYTSLKIVNGKPAVSYVDATNGDLKYVCAAEASGMAWATSLSIDVAGYSGEYNSLQIVNGNPAISYLGSNNGLKYVRALDASGTAWGAPISIDVTGIVGFSTSLQIVNGNPAISYYDYTNRDLKYVRATDASGTAWGTPISIDVTGYVGEFTSLQIVNGNPAISYYDGTNLDLKYVRATDASGTAWGTPLSIDVAGYVGQYTSLQIVNGNPAISYYDVANYDLKYIRATDASGTAWGTPLSIDVAGNVGQYTSLQVVKGNPAISYYDATNGDLKYVRATDVSGSAWATSSIPDASQRTGLYTSMISTSGEAAIAYYNQSQALPYYISGKNTFISQASNFFRSKQTGNWNDPASWESSPDNTNWGPATLTPDFTANTITIKTGHTINVTADVTVDQLVIEPGSSMIIKTGNIFTVN